MASDVLIGEASAADLQELLAVQRRAFSRTARQFDFEPERLPPVREPLEELQRLYAEGAVFLVARDGDGRIVGGVRGELSEGSVAVGRLVVEDGWERRGVASALLEALETAYPSAGRFTLFTGEGHTGALRLYERLGYTVFDRELTPDGVPLVYMEKRVER